MIFLVSTLTMNGGSTFVLRAAREYHRQGKRCAVILFSDRVDPGIVADLEICAQVIPLSRFLRDRGVFARGLLSVFAPINMGALSIALAPFGRHLHAMGLFGLILGLRLAADDHLRRLTVGIYHQNEFLYRPSPFHLAKEGRRIFAAMPQPNVVFFSESSRDNYAIAFPEKRFDHSSPLPIGISLDLPALPRGQARQRIVSIGNLVGFKTYNRHIIEIVADIRERFPDVRFDVFGTGPLTDELSVVVETLDLSSHVCFHGTLPYERFRDEVAECDLFVGSGTALIEAAAVGRPAMIGIESMTEPVTYGFLSEAKGLSYNENMPNVPKVAMAPLVEAVLGDPDYWQIVASACADKAQSFSISTTVNGLRDAGAAAQPVTERLSAFDLARLAASAIVMRLAELIGIGQAFGNRRDQAY